MRPTLPALLAALLALGCGGGGTDPDTPPPPPPPAPAASLAAHAGAAQAGEPGTPAAVRPAVIVRNAAGAPVANATVAFAVESGGGTVTGGTVTTGADGIATVGGWTLGPLEGEQALVATSGALSPVRFVATAAVPTRVVTSQTISTGTLAITTGPLAGTRLEIPAGAFASGSAWVLEQRSSAGWPTRPGVHPVGATLRISRPEPGLAALPMLLTLPAPVPPGTKPFVLIRDPASGGLHLLHTVNVENGLITVAAMHFDPSYLVPPAPAGGGFGPRAVRATSGTGYDVEVVVSAIPVAELDKDQTSNYLPGRDDWEIRPFPTAVEDPAGGSVVHKGLVLSSMVRRSVTGLPALNGLHRQVAGQELSNRVGFRAAADLGEGWGNSFFAAITAIRNATRAGIADQLAYDWLKAALYVTGLPQMATAATAANAWTPLVAWRAAGGQVFLANPQLPGNAAISVPFANGTFGSFSVVPDFGGSVPAQWLMVTAMMQFIKVSGVASDLAEWEAGRYPASDQGRTPLSQGALDGSIVLKANGGFLEQDTLLILTHDTTRYWVECGACIGPLLPSSLAARGVAPFLALYDDAGTIVNVGSMAPEGKLLAQTQPLDSRVGFVMLESDGQDVRWLDFRWMRFRKWVLDARPPLSWSLSQPAAWTVLVDGTAPPPHEFVWTFGTGASALTQATAASTEWITLTGAQISGDSIPYRVEMRRLSDGKVLASKAGMIKAPQRAAWRLATVTALTNPSCNRVPQIWACESNMGAPAPVTDWVIIAHTSSDAAVPAPWHTPGIYLMESAPALGAPVGPRPGLRVVPLGHLHQDAARGISGTFTWNGAVEDGAVSGTSTLLNLPTCNGIRTASITATKTPGGLSGTITFGGASWPISDLHCAGPPTGPIPNRAYGFTAVLVP